jgi:acyl carrier protein
MQKSDLKSMVREILEIALKLDPTEVPDINRQDIASWDSLKHVEIIFLLEDKFHIQFDEDEMATMNSLSKITERVEKQIAP